MEKETTRFRVFLHCLVDEIYDEEARELMETETETEGERECIIKRNCEKKRYEIYDLT